MNLHKNRFGPIDARMYLSVMSALRTLGIIDAPLSNFAETRMELTRRLQKFERDCASYPLDILDRVEDSLISLINISHLVKDSRDQVFGQILTEKNHQHILAVLRTFQTTRTQLANVSDLPLSCAH